MSGIKPIALKTSINYLLTKSGNRVSTISKDDKITKAVITNGVDSIEKEYSTILIKDVFDSVNGYCNAVKISKNGKYQSNTFIEHNKNGDLVSIFKHEPWMPFPTKVFVAKKK